MAENKQAGVTFKTKRSLKESFDAELARRAEFANATDFFEQAMSALVQAGRRGGKVAIPVAILSEDDAAKLRIG